MTQSSGSAAQVVKNEPAFRRGWWPIGYKALLYETISVEQADQAWRQLVSHGLWIVVYADGIAEAMGTYTRRAALLRRAFAALDLLTERPGSPWDEEPRPAVVILHSLNPNDLANALPDGTDGLVVSTTSLPDQGTSRSSLRSAVPVASGDIYMRTRRAGIVGPEFVSLPGQEGRTSSSSRHDGETNTWGAWIEVPSPQCLYLTRHTAHSAKPTPPSLDLAETFKAAEIMAARRCSRATAYRLRDHWLARGLVEQVGRNLYQQKKDRLTLISNPG